MAADGGGTEVPPAQIGYLADTPIDDPEADRLQRRSFANRIITTGQAL